MPPSLCYMVIFGLKRMKKQVVPQCHGVLNVADFFVQAPPNIACLVPTDVRHLIVELLDGRSLAQLRLTSKEWEKTASQRYFKEFTIYQHPRCWAKLRALQHRKRLAKYLKRIWILREPMLPHYEKLRSLGKGIPNLEDHT